MVMNRGVQLAIVATTLLWQPRCDSASPVMVICGRQLAETVARVCDTFRGYTESPKVVDQYGTTITRRKREDPLLERGMRRDGIADDCCNVGCTWEYLTEYCPIVATPLQPHEVKTSTTGDRSAEIGTVTAPAVKRKPVHDSTGEGGPGAGGTAGVGAAGVTRRQVGRGRSRGYGRARGRRCWCRRKRRSGRRRSSLMGNMGLIRNAQRAAPVVGTVSPLLTWGRTLSADLPPAGQHRYPYVAIYP